MKVYKFTILICSIMTTVVIYFMITIGMGWLIIVNPTVTRVFQSIIAGLVGSGTYATINSIIGYLNAKHRSVENYYYAVTDFFRLVSQYCDDMSNEEVMRLFNEILRARTFHRIKVSYNEISFIRKRNKVNQIINKAYQHCLQEERVIRALANDISPKNVYAQMGMNREEIREEFEQLFAQNEDVWKELVNVYYKYAE